MSNMNIAFQTVGTDIKGLNDKIKSLTVAMGLRLDEAQVSNLVKVLVGDVSTLSGGHQTLTAAVAALQSESATGGAYTAEKNLAASDVNALKDSSDSETNALIILAKAIKKLVDANYVNGSQVDAKVNEAVTNLVDGAPENLNTLVELANQIQANGGSLLGLTNMIGQLSSLTTTAKDSIVAAINEVSDTAKAAKAATEVDYLAVYTAARGSLD